MRIRHTNGFTLAELLVVVAIIAILVAVSIPIFSQKLETARTNTCLANQRSLKAVLVNGYNAETIEPDRINTIKLNEDNEYKCTIDNEIYKCPSGGEITCKYDETGNFITVTCSIHNGKASGGSAESKNFAWKDIFSKIEASLGVNNVTVFNSDYTNVSGNSATRRFLESGGSDLIKDFNASIWQARAKTFTWTTEKETKTGDTVNVIRYNSSNGTYQIGTSKLIHESTAPNGTNRFGETSMNKETYKTYEEALAAQKSN